MGILIQDSESGGGGGEKFPSKKTSSTSFNNQQNESLSRHRKQGAMVRHPVDMVDFTSAKGGGATITRSASTMESYKPGMHTRLAGGEKENRQSSSFLPLKRAGRLKINYFFFAT